MRPSILFLPVIVLACAAAYAETPQSQPGQKPQSGESAAAPQKVHLEDGGVSERLESIVVPPKAHAPFSSMLQTEWVRELADGGTITWVNERRIARDGNGRVYQERWALVPKGQKEASMMTTIQISDPSRHTTYSCFTSSHVCRLSEYDGSTSVIYRMEGPPTGPLPGDMGFAVQENLGKQLISGMETEGTRESTIYNPGVFGNDRKVTVSREFWYSPQLGLNLLSKRSDPRFGTQNFTVTNLILSEPDPHLYELPEGYTVVDVRETVQPPASPAAN
jgi:hypothetical protein